MHDKILILDFGSQVTQLIARRVREAGVYCEIAPFSGAGAAFARMQPAGIIFSGGPASVGDAGSPRAPTCLFDSGLPILGICYGQQVMVTQLGGAVESGHAAEFGRADVEILKPSPLFDGFWEAGEKYPVWMSHGDRVTTAPDGFEIIGVSPNAPFAICVDEARQYYTTMFHPEVVHTPDGAKLIANFVRHVCGCSGDWTMAEFRATKIAEIRAQVGDQRVLCGLSGGVDSAVAAVAGGVAAGAAEFGFLDERAFGVVEVGNVVVFEEVGAAAVDAALVAFFDHEFLSFGVVAVQARDVDGVALGVVDHRPECRGVGDSLDDRAADGGAVVEGAAVGSDVEDDLGDHVGAAGARQRA